jgi:hypothetical protein
MKPVTALAPKAWDAHAEAIFSLWIARLFTFPVDDVKDTLKPLLRSASQNLLYNHLGLGEDDERSPLALGPDCADMPLALRAYFAWKLGLPFGIDRPWRPEDDAPKPDAFVDASTVDTPDARTINAGSAHDLDAGSTKKRVFELFVDPTTPADALVMQASLTRLSTLVSAGDLRLETGSETSILYPVALRRASLKPGAPYVDPYSHVSMVAAWERVGVDHTRLVVADAQPNGMVALHRYVDGRLVYRTGFGVSGFRWYRPTVRDEDKGFVPASSLSLLGRPDPDLRPDYSEIRRPEASFFERIETLQDPHPRDPVEAYRELHDATIEALRTRERVVHQGFLARLASPLEVPLPTTASLLFHGLGAWEAYATPCRDLKLLGLLRAITSFPEKVASNPARYLLEPGEDGPRVRSRLEKAREPWWDEPGVTYKRSDDAETILSLRAILLRRAAFEAAYNPNDCPELRWGAALGSDEARACVQRASEAQRAKMESYRGWFKEGYGCE